MKFPFGARPIFRCELSVSFRECELQAALKRSRIWELGKISRKKTTNLSHPGTHQKKIGTPPKSNMEPENGGLEDDFPFQTGDFQVPCWFSGVYVYKTTIKQFVVQC